MASLRILILLLFASRLYAQSTESDIKTDIDAARLQTLTPARVYGIMDKINYGKQSIKGIYTASGTNTYSVTTGAGIVNNDAGIQITVKFTNANTTGAATLNVNGNGAMPLKTNLGSDHDVGGIKANGIYEAASTGTTWQVVGPTNEGGELTTEFGEIGGALPDQTDLYDTLNTKARKIYKIKPIATNYSAALGDHDNKFVIIGGGSTFTIPKDADVNFPIGASLLYGDSLETATFTKDPAVHIDTLDIGVAIKLAANKWGVPRSQSGGGAALTDGSGTTANGSAVDLGGTLTGDGVVVVGDGLAFGILDPSLAYGMYFSRIDEEIVLVAPGASGGTIRLGDVDGGVDITGVDIDISGTGATSQVHLTSSVQIGANDDIIMSSGPGSTDDIIFNASSGKTKFDNIVTTAGTTGAQTIDRTSGVVNFAAGTSTLVVTNSHCSASSMVFVQVLGVDTAAKYAVVTRASGSFTITLNAVAVAELPVCFFVIN